ncbi:FixH family protein [Campylobacter mucosalis]|uniref:FixH family protein n=1 Tax=Campylobacter mucosalis TaxID=202 RepID=UPI00146FEA16|nr:FixH family protein [Campylobacter mucosalis]
MRDKKTFWPYGIVISILGCVALCVGTIWVSLDYPVELDGFYLQNKTIVNDNINEIIAKQKAFDEKFSVSLKTQKFKIGSDENVKIAITPKTDEKINLNYQILLTRPDTNAYNKELNATINGNILTTSKIEPTLEGRWQIMLKLSAQDIVGFYKLEFFVVK